MKKYDYLRKIRTSKHRYIYFTGKSRKKLIKMLKYKELPYPKEENKNYVLGEKIKFKIINKNTGEVFYE